MGACKIFLLWIVLLASVPNAFCQEKKKLDLNQLIEFSNSSIRLDSLLRRITKETGFIFSYNTRNVNQNTILSVAARKYSIESLLTRIREKTGLTYSISDNHIILKFNKSYPSPLKVQSAPTKVEARNTPVLKSTATLDSLTTNAVKTDVMDGPTKTVPLETQTPDPQKAYVAAIQSKKPPRDSTVRQSKVATKKAQQNNPWSLQMHAGLSIDETTYAGPMVQIGFPSLYAAASYKTDFNVWLLSYGLGTSFKVNNKFRANFSINTGSLSRNYSYVPLDTSTKINNSIRKQNQIIAKGQLTRISIMLERKLNPKVVLQFGLQYNMLSTKYFVDDLPSSIGFTGNDSDKRFYALSPPYLLQNSYNVSSSSNEKSWIGLQLNILYTINFPKGR